MARSEPESRDGGAQTAAADGAAPAESAARAEAEGDGPEAGGGDPWERYRPLAGAGPAALLVLVALWEILSVALIGTGMPDDGDWRRAAEALRRQHQPGQLIVFAPDWIGPVGRQHLGDLIPIDMAARMDEARYGVIWELAARGDQAEITEELEAAETQRFGHLELRRYEQEPAQVAFDVVADFASAEVSGGRAAVRLEEVGFRPRRCVRAVPRPGQTVTIRYPQAELGTELVGYVGLADVFTRRDIREPGRLEVRVDGQVVAEVEPGVDDGWVRFSAPTEPGPAELSFAASAQVRDRLICFAAEARR